MDSCFWTNAMDSEIWKTISSLPTCKEYNSSGVGKILKGYIGNCMVDLSVGEGNEWNDTK